MLNIIFTAAAMNFGISKSIVSGWKSMQYALTQALLNARKLGSGAKHQFPKEEQCFLMKFVEKTSHGYTASCTQIQAKLRQLIGKHCFRASTGSYMDFCSDINLHRELALRQSII
jgi:hypothetical protein